MKRLLMAALCVFAVGCGNDNDDNNANSGTTAPAPEAPAQVRDWSSVSFKWMGMVENPETDCDGGSFRAKRDKTMESNECGVERAAIMSDADFANVQSALAPVLASFDSRINCDPNEITADYDYELKITSEGVSKKMYEYGNDGQCERGDRAALENLERVLNETSAKYFP